MQATTTKELYKQFTHELLNTTLKMFSDATMLVTNFVDNAYMTVFQDNKEPLKHYLIITNIKKGNVYDIQARYNSGGYIVFNVDDLWKPIPPKQWKELIKSGLFYQDKEGRDRYKPLIAMHRLVSCIGYGDIKGRIIHHVNKIKDDNRLDNLIPCLFQSDNVYLDTRYKTTDEVYIRGVKGVQDYYKKKLLKAEARQRQTLTLNDNLHLDIIKYALTHDNKDVIKHFKNKIKTPQTIRDILNFYYHKKQFIRWLDNREGV